MVAKVQWAWVELNGRTLLPAEKALLLDTALQQRREISYFGRHSGMGAWLDAEILSGNLSQKELNRIRVESWIPELVVPDRATSGTPFTAILQGEQREDFLPPGEGTTILFDGFRVGDGPVVGRETNTLWTLHANSTNEGDFRHFKKSLSIDTPGTHTIRATYWLMDRPFGKLDDPVERDADGRPILPVHSTWMIPLSIENTIVVEEPVKPSNDRSTR